MPIGTPIHSFHCRAVLRWCNAKDTCGILVRSARRNNNILSRLAMVRRTPDSVVSDPKAVHVKIECAAVR